jgi:hypothetical protein
MKGAFRANCEMVDDLVSPSFAFPFAAESAH